MIGVSKDVSLIEIDHEYKCCDTDLVINARF